MRFTSALTCNLYSSVFDRGRPSNMLPLPKAWLPGRASGSHDGQHAPETTEDASTAPTKLSKVSPRPPIDRAITAAISTPHDSVLAELQGQRPDVNTSARIDAELPPLATIPSLGSLERPGASPVPGARSDTATPNTSPEPLYDPFTGALAYVLPGTQDRDCSPFEQAKDELWSQLGRIRELQGEIATLHTQMEGVGTGEGRKPRRGAARTHSDTIVGEEWPDLAEVEQEKEKAREGEFASLSQAFEGRHAAIGNIMEKVRCLSIPEY